MRERRAIVILNYIKLFASNQDKYWLTYILLFTFIIPGCGIFIVTLFMYANLYLPPSYEILVNRGHVSILICTLMFAILTSLPLLNANHKTAKVLKSKYQHKKVGILTLYNHCLSISALFILGYLYFQWTIF